MLTVKGIRTNCITGEKRDVRVEVDLLWYKHNINCWYVTIVKGGVTGYESFKFSDMNPDGIGWTACAGTQSRWDTLFIPGSEMRRIYEEFKHKAGNVKIY